jgi:hypothetical protein
MVIILFLYLIVHSLMTQKEGLETMDPSTNQTTTDEYQPYDTSNPNNVMILAQQNAGNISVLKQQLDDLGISHLEQEIQDMSGNITSLQQQVNGLVTAQQEYASQINGGQPPVITGTVEDEEDEEDADTDIVIPQ